MLPEYAKARIDDVRGKNDVEFETNFSDDPDLKDYVRVTLGGNTAIIAIKDLFAFTFAVANEEQQADMVPVTRTMVKKLVKHHKIQVKKPLKPGDFLVARCETNVPVEVTNALRGDLSRWHEKKVKSSPILVPGVLK